MAKSRRGHRPPPQSFAQVPQQVPVIQNPNQRDQQVQLAIKSKIESLAATIYTEAVSATVGDPSLSEEYVQETIEKIADRAIDAALVLGKSLWGIEGQRMKPPAKPKKAPGVIVEEDAV